LPDHLNGHRTPARAGAASIPWQQESTDGTPDDYTPSGLQRIERAATFDQLGAAIRDADNIERYPVL
jgi:hypothetical protein